MEMYADNPSGYDMPKPSRVILLDDLSAGDPVLESEVSSLAACLDSPYKPVVVTPLQLINRLKRKYDRDFRCRDGIDILIGIGSSGLAIARELDQTRPILTFSPTRQTDERGLVNIVSKTGMPLHEELLNSFAENGVDPLKVRSVGFVDDTVFSGVTLSESRRITRNLTGYQDESVYTLTYIPFMAEEFLGESGVNVVAALTLKSADPGEQQGLNSLDVRDFIMEDALPLADKRSIPFMREENWMRAWFGNKYDQAMVICGRMREVVDRRNLKLYQGKTP